jgi:hypothetical protein
MFAFKVELREAVTVSNLMRTYCIGSLLGCIDVHVRIDAEYIAYLLV